jgi:membrane-bound lytic murein transglycosylase B
VPEAPVAPASPDAAAGTVAPMPFADWLKGVREEALQRGIRPETVQRALDGVEPVPQILERDRAQAEFSINIAQYFQRRLTREILDNAKKYFADHRELLTRVQTQYGVQARYLIAVWALESNFGRFAGVRPMMPTLATLAYDPRRATLFRQQLFDALTVLDKGYIELDALKGSWAGAMGQPQFMPSSYLEYAQDFDGDGRRDIWTSEADVFASIAFYLARHDWEKGEPWGRRVTVPASAEARLVEQAPLRTAGCRAERQLSIARPVSVWRKMGILRADGGALPPAAHDAPASLLRTDDGKSYLVSRNYEAFLSYNCANAYALSVGHLGDAIEGLGPLPVTLKKKPVKRASTATKTRGTKGSKGSKASKPRKAAPAQKSAAPKILEPEKSWGNPVSRLELDTQPPAPTAPALLP